MASDEPATKEPVKETKSQEVEDEEEIVVDLSKPLKVRKCYCYTSVLSSVVDVAF